MPHIPYVDPETVTDPEIKGYLEVRAGKARRGRKARRCARTCPT